MKNTVILGLSASKSFTEQVRKKLNVKSIDPTVKKFADGEIYVRLAESVRGKNVYIIQSTSNPINDNLMELVITMDACRRASAAEITLIMPYMGYARQDRKAKSREPITSKVVAAMLEVAGADRIITFDLHSSQIQGFFRCPVDDLAALNMIAQELKMDKEIKKPVIVAPDHGGSKRARVLADMLGCDVAVIDKSRPEANKVEIMGMIGNVKDRDAIIIDDMIDTGGTICRGASKVIEEGANSVVIAATHGLFSGNAKNKLQNSPARRIIITNTINQLDMFEKLTIVSLSNFIAEVILANVNHESVGIVYEKWAK